MINLSDVLATPIVQALGLTLLHFLWQGTLLALVFAALLFVLRGLSAQLRYLISYFGLALMVAASVGTYIYLAPSAKPAYTFVETPRAMVAQSAALAATTDTTTLQNARPAEGSSAPQASPRPYRFPPKSLKAYLPLLVSLWFFGVIILSIRLLGGLILAQQLRKKGIKPVAETLEIKLRDLSKKLNVSRAVRLRESVAVTVPLVIGWLKPVILLPTTVITGLSPEQLELILAHELAHIRRNDYLVNILQKLAETLLFYHPAVWWLSGVIRQERENCCDDMAIDTCGEDKLAYAKTLARLESLRPPSQLAMSASGGSLLKRIRRLAGKPTEVSNPVQWLMVMCLALFPWAILSVATAQASLPKVIEDNIDAFVEERLKTWNLPGLQMAVVKDGEIAFNKAFGLADVENNIPMRVDTPMPVGTLSRAFTVIAIMQLVEQGKLKLDGTLAEYLPWVKLSRDLQNTLTLQNLLTPEGHHGFYPGMVDLLCKPDCQSRVPAGITTKEDYVKSLLPDKLVLTGYDSIATRARLSAILLGLIIEKVAGTTFEDYVHSHIFLPLQLNASYDLTQARQQGLAKGYIYASGDLTSSFTLESKPYTMPAVFNPYTGLVMSSSDLAKFLMTLLSRDTKILSTDTWTRLLSASSDLGLFRGLVSESYTINGQDAIFLLCTLENASLKIDIFPATNEAQLSLVNWQSYEAIEGLHTPLFIAANILLNEPANATEDIDESLPNPKAEIMAYVAGKYSSPVGPIELYGLGEELHGKIMGHNFVLKLIEEPEKGIGWGSFSFQSRSDYKVFNGLRFLLDGNDIDLFTSYTHFAYRIDAEE